MNHSGWKVFTPMMWSLPPIGVMGLALYIDQIVVLIIGGLWFFYVVRRAHKWWYKDSYPSSNKWGDGPIMIDVNE